MNNLQKWLVVLALWVAAIGIFLGALAGRYERVKASSSGELAKFDTWTGTLYSRKIDSGHWEKVRADFDKQ